MRRDRPDGPAAEEFRRLVEIGLELVVAGAVDDVLPAMAFTLDVDDDSDEKRFSNCAALVISLSLVISLLWEFSPIRVRGSANIRDSTSVMRCIMVACSCGRA